MAYKTVYTLSDIRYLWKSRGNKNYAFKHLNTEGNFIQSITFRDISNQREVSGKFVDSPREGEAYHWPRLKHENLAPLLDIVSINEILSIYITEDLKRSLRNVACEDGFLRNSTCFDRKKSYAEGVLWGLDYLHGKNLVLLNLSEDNIYINERDQAVITDFRRLVMAERATKYSFFVPSLYCAPELGTTLSLESFDPIKAEVWACGVMLLQIFTRYAIPATFPAEQRNLAGFLAKLDQDVLVQANIGASITPIDLRDLKNFLSLFLCMDPSSRASVKTAAVDVFLKGNISEHSELKSPKLDDTPDYIDVTENFAEESMGNSEVKRSTSNYLKPFTPLSDAMIIRRRLRSHSPSNTFINLQNLPICRTREEYDILDSLSSGQSNWNMQSMKKESNEFHLYLSDINETEMQKVKGDTQNEVAQEAKSLPNICGIFEEIKNVPIQTHANPEKSQLESLTNISTQLNKTNDNLKIENCSFEEESDFQKDFSEELGGISKKNMLYSKEFRKTFAKNSNENNNSSYIKIGHDTPIKKSNSVCAYARNLPTSDCEQSYLISPWINNPVFDLSSPRYLGIFRNSSFPNLYRSPFHSSFYCNTSVNRSVSLSSHDIQFMKPSGSYTPKPLILDANVHNTGFSIQRWGYFSFNPEKNIVGEGDRNKSQLNIYKEKYSGSTTNIHSGKKKLTDISSLNLLKVSYFDTPEAETNVNFACLDEFRSDNTDVPTLPGEVNTSISDSKNLASMEPNRKPSCSNVRNNPAKSSYGYAQTEDIKNFNSKFSPEIIKENNFIGEIKEQADVYTIECGIPDGLNVSDNGVNRIHPVAFEMKQAEDLELSTTISEQESIQENPQHLDFYDRISVFEKNFNTLEEVSLCQSYFEDKAKPNVKKKHKKKSWLRHLCPGCKVYRDDK